MRQGRHEIVRLLVLVLDCPNSDYESEDEKEDDLVAALAWPQR